MHNILKLSDPPSQKQTNINAKFNDFRILKQEEKLSSEILAAAYLSRKIPIESCWTKTSFKNLSC